MLKLAEVLDDFRAYAKLNGDVTIHSRSLDGETALHWMATLGDLAGVELLLKARSDPNEQDETGNSPLHAAVEARQIGAVKLLVSAGCRANLVDSLGRTPLELAKQIKFNAAICELSA